MRIEQVRKLAGLAVVALMLSGCVASLKQVSSGQTGCSPEEIAVSNDHFGWNVRTWTADEWSAAPRTSAERADTLLKWLEVQQRLGRTMNQSPTVVRLWLRGEGTAR